MIKAFLPRKRNDRICLSIWFSWFLEHEVTLTVLTDAFSYNNTFESVHDIFICLIDTLHPSHYIFQSYSGEARARHLSILCRAPMIRLAPHEIVLSSYAYLVRFSNKMLVFRVDIHKMLVRIANREYPDLGLPCLSMPFWQTTGVRNI